MHRFSSRLVASLSLAAALAACAKADTAEDSITPEPPGSSATPSANIVEVQGSDFTFDAPLDIPSGWTTFRFVNTGPEPHHLSLLRLENGHTPDDLVAAIRDRKPIEGIATALGGPNAGEIGMHTSAAMRLEPGQYVLTCFIPSPDGTPHIFKGMIKPITVRTDAAGVEPGAPDARITFTDYAFNVTGELAAGERTILASTDPGATEPHEVVVVRLASGKTVADVNEWMHTMEGPPPGEFIGGVTGIDPGHSNSFTVTLTPGEYALLCPIPSNQDGQPHSMKGMVHQFTVR